MSRMCKLGVSYYLIVHHGHFISNIIRDNTKPNTVKSESRVIVQLSVSSHVSCAIQIIGWGNKIHPRIITMDESMNHESQDFEYLQNYWKKYKLLNAKWCSNTHLDLAEAVKLSLEIKIKFNILTLFLEASKIYKEQEQRGGWQVIPNHPLLKTENSNEKLYLFSGR